MLFFSEQEKQLSFSEQTDKIATYVFKAQTQIFLTCTCTSLTNVKTT